MTAWFPQAQDAGGSGIGGGCVLSVAIVAAYLVTRHQASLTYLHLVA